MIFSMPTIAMCTGGRKLARRMLPSLSTSISVPVSAAIRVRAGDADVGVQKLVAQPFARELRQRFSGIQRKIGLEFALEQRGDALAAVVQRRRQEVRRLLVRQLQDKFREIALDHFDPIRLQNVVEANFLGRDALAFHHQLRGPPVAHIQNVAASVLGRVGDENMPTVRANRVLERFASSSGRLAIDFSLICRV